jgi:hypothetical protein
MSKNILIISPNSIKERSGLAGNVDEKLLYPEIKTSQDMYIHPALGTALYNRILTGIQANNLTPGEVTLINEYIADTLVYYVLSELSVELNYQFYTKGVVQKTGENTNQPSMQDLLDISARYKTRAEFYKERLINYLKYQASIGNFPLYINPGSTIETILPDNDAYTSSIFLDDCYDYKHKRTFSEKYQGNIFRNCNDC